ncbi:MAG: phosphoribosylamine--glycine ligase, partial [Planctomycetes bacterium]|nr:phosphoribosylamine--glycine ligase [Planctomycetota bacterium]
VIKADGLAAGKGVLICLDNQAGEEAVENLMEKKSFGSAGETIIIEEFLTGEEISILSITDGQTIVVLEPSQDHKRAFDNDQGPNTGGMGAYSPPPFLKPKLMNQIIREILVPTIHAMKRMNRPYRGVLYAGLILTPTGPKVLEFNVRFGDPETQPLMIRLKSDLVPLLLAATEGRLEKSNVKVEWTPQTSVCVVMASGGYPGSYQKGLPIKGLNNANQTKTATVFHAGTALKGSEVITTGGRVLGITALGQDIKQARQHAYELIKKISWDGAFYRNDIGMKALNR